MLFLAFCIALVRVTTSKYCSALQSYVEVTTSSPDWPIQTYILLSSQALFPPHTYHIPPTPLVALPDPLCHPNVPLSTNITNKTVLLFESAGNCSIHQKVLFAQRNGAIAVLMANDDSSENVVNVIDDNTLSHIDTHIPMRSITKDDGKWLRHMTLSDPPIEVLIEFGCYSNTLYPSILCLRDSSGVLWTLNGEYEKQPNVQINGHPVWKLSRYPLYLDPLYIFLHDANGDTDWFWALTSDSSFVDDDALVIRCSVASVSDPSLCPSWSEIYDSGLQLKINITDDVCPIGTHDICIYSRQSHLVGLSGTYSLAINGVAEWIRDLTECDRRAEVLIFKESGNYQGGFVLYNPLQELITAYCLLPPELSENGTYTTNRYRPDLCTEWKRKDDIESNIILNISIGTCVHTPNCIPSDAPDRLCMIDNTFLHGYLMGEYVKLNTTGSHFNSPIYKRVTYDDISGYNELYIWYSDELFASVGYMDLQHFQEQGWYLTDYSLEMAASESILHPQQHRYYGYCPGYSFGNPVNCDGWVFEGGLRHFDEEMTVTEGQCTENFLPKLPNSWPPYVCIGLKDGSDRSNPGLSHSLFVGRYGIHMERNGFPVWNKIERNGFPIWYLWFTDDKLWTVSTDLMHHGKVNSSNRFGMRCDSYYKSNSLNPIHCVKWLDGNGAYLDDIYLYECTEKTTLRLEKYDVVQVVEMVGVIVFGISCISCVILLCVMCQKSEIPQKKDVDIIKKTGHTLDKMNGEHMTFPQSPTPDHTNINIEI